MCHDPTGLASLEMIQLVLHQFPHNKNPLPLLHTSFFFFSFFSHRFLFLFFSFQQFLICLFINMAEKKVVLKLLTMTDERTKQKAMEAVADIYGVDSIAADLKEQKLTVIGEMDTIAIAKKLKKIGKIDIISVGPAKEPEKKPEEKKPDPPAAAAAAAAPAKKPEEKK
ncbi:hypothetical protein C5167_004834 [Papaver somniferum]|uniref:HMA domain-containing protein n=2 Tax=Papaver somniferum TaxID=3469 RepID=A0A4Y7J8R0_PAPSO|nr:hypothetical protein C5167_004834 [Papaver somniferum]